MDFFTTPSRIIVTCGKRLSPYLEREIRDLGFVPKRVFATGVELEGSVNDCIRFNLNLRCASQVLYSLKAFTAHDPEDVYASLRSLPWETVLDTDGYFSVTGHVDHETVNNPLFMNVRVKDAIADRIRARMGHRPDSGSELAGAVIHLFWKNENAEIFLDTSGETLSKHGYRKLGGRAPMLESLAAATLLATSWDRRSPFVNPMCGSGTVAIEAALLATDRRPGLFRDQYAFMHIKGYRDEVYVREYKKLEARVQDVPGLRIIATDIDKEALRISKINVSAAGVGDLIEFAAGDFETTEMPEAPGVIYFNPEYGERLGDATELEATYARLGDFMKKKAQGYMGYVFTGNLDLAKKIGLKPKRRLEFYTGKIDSRLYEYELYAGTRETKKDRGDLCPTEEI